MFVTDIFHLKSKEETKKKKLKETHSLVASQLTINKGGDYATRWRSYLARPISDRVGSIDVQLNRIIHIHIWTCTKHSDYSDSGHA